MQSMREVNLDTYSLSLLTAKEDILNPRSSTNWYGDDFGLFAFFNFIFFYPYMWHVKLVEIENVFINPKKKNVSDHITLMLLMK